MTNVPGRLALGGFLFNFMGMFRLQARPQRAFSRFLLTSSLLLTAGLLSAQSDGSGVPSLPTTTVTSVPILPVEDFFKNPDYSSVVVSPDGTHLAALVPVNGRRNVAVIDLSTRTPRVITSFADDDVGSVTWLKNTTLGYTIDRQGRYIGAMWAVERDGSRNRELFPVLPENTAFRFYRILDLLPENPNEILVTYNARLADYPDVFLMNLRNGRTRVYMRNPGNISGWGTDHEGKVRLATTESRDGLLSTVLWRAQERDEWKTLAEFRLGERAWSPVGFDDDNRTLLIASNLDADTAGIFTLNPVTGEKGEMIYRHSRYDAGGPIVRRADDKVIGVTVTTVKPEQVWFERDLATWQRSLDQEFPDTLNLITSADDSFKTIVVAHSSPRHPVRYSLLKLETSQLISLFPSRPWIDPEQMADMKPISYAARDGRTIHGYLTVPVGSDGKDLPFILHPHGGPWARDVMGFNREVQFLANRGFAVLQVDFRGSTGYGFDHLHAARGQFGLTMQDDLTDAVKWAIAEGIADPERVGIYGASYGGYATMAGLVFTPELFAFGINYVGVVDLVDQVNFYKDVRDSESAFNYWAFWCGHPKDDAERLKAVSPLFFVDRIKVPLMVIHGGEDFQVPVRQYNMLVRELRAKDIPFTSVFRSDEGHGFRREENNFALYSEMDTFLAPFRTKSGSSD